MSIEVDPVVCGIVSFGLIVSLAFAALCLAITVFCDTVDDLEKRGNSILCGVSRACAGAIFICYASASIVAMLVWLKGVIE